MDLSVVIVAYNETALLRACLASLPAAAGALAHEAIVVANGGPAEVADMVAAEFPSVHLIRLDVNGGLAAANNRGIARAAGRYTLILNPDTVAAAGALETLVRFADARPDAGIVGPQLRNPDGSLQPSGRRAPSPVRLLAGALVPAWGPPVGPDGRDYQALAEVEEVCGAAMLVRREVWASGLQDEGLPFCYEDVDLCLRARREGWRVIYCPAAVIVHHGGASGGIGDPAVRERWRQGQLHFMRKHHGAVPAALLSGVYALKRLVRRWRPLGRVSGAGAPR